MAIRKLFLNIIRNTIEKLYLAINLREIKKGDIVLHLTRSLQPDWWSCAIHSTYSILNYYKKCDDISALEEYICFDGIDTPVIIEMLEKHNLRLSEIWDSNHSDIKTAIDNGNPILTTINDTEHWVVINGYSLNEENEISHLFVVDPALKRIRAKWSIEKFESMWLEWDERWLGIVIES